MYVNICLDKIVSKNSRPNQAFFSKVDDIKIERKVSFFPPLVYRPFIAVLSLFFSLLQGLEAAFRRCEIKVKNG